MSRAFCCHFLGLGVLAWSLAAGSLIYGQASYRGKHEKQFFKESPGLSWQRPSRVILKPENCTARCASCLQRYRPFEGTQRTGHLSLWLKAQTLKPGFPGSNPSLASWLEDLGLLLPSLPALFSHLAYDDGTDSSYIIKLK